MKESHITYSSDETIDVAKTFAKQVKPGDVICLQGDLGAGKTTWVKGLALGLGLSANESVTSPTFSLMHRYTTQPPLYHFDCYRIDSPGELTDIGFEEFVNDKESIMSIEWPEKAKALIPSGGWNVTLSHQSDGGRLILIDKR